MKIMIDTNVILDYILDRQPFSHNAGKVLESCVRGEHTGCILVSAITDIFYIAEKYMDDLHILYLLIEDLLENILLVDLSRKDFMEALEKREKDFEDCILAVCAANAGCDLIVTRNPKDFKNAVVTTVTPEQFVLKYLNQKH